MLGVSLVIGAVRRTGSSILITVCNCIALHATNTQQLYRGATKLKPNVWRL